jgi:hypothetical protein
MNTRNRSSRFLLLNLLAVFALLVGSWTTPAWAQEGDATDAASLTAVNAPENLVVMYSAKFVCTEALKPGQFFYGVAAPIVQQSTDVLVHNPNGFPVRLFKKAVIAPLEKFDSVEQGVAPGKWKAVTLAPDYAFRIDCDDIAKLLTGDAAATFLGVYGLGVTVEGFVVVGIGAQQPVAGSPLRRFAPLDVTAEYARSSEVMKKDIHLQPWWRWWWWQLPWRLGYPYRRILRLQPGAAPASLDLRDLLVRALKEELTSIADSQQREVTMTALDNGLKLELEPHMTNQEASEQAPALMLIMSDPQFVSSEGALSVDFVMVSNKAPSEPNPLGGDVVQPVAVRYPWIPGHWYNLPLLMPQNVNIDLHHHLVKWHAERWLSAGTNVDVAAVNANLVYWYPYWCGWGYWWWGWHGTDCIDIGVGEGESLDVEQITPVRVFMPQWPPTVAQ